jgi:hypothetical protein
MYFYPFLRIKKFLVLFIVLNIELFFQCVFLELGKFIKNKIKEKKRKRKKGKEKNSDNFVGGSYFARLL